MSNRWGIHWPNGEFDDWRGCLGMGVSNFTVLHHQADYVLLMVEASLGGVIHVRYYLPNWRAVNPTEWGRSCGVDYKRIRRCPKTNRTFTLRDLKVRVTLANEQNLASEGGGASEQDYRDINTWNLAAAKSFYDETGVKPDWPAVAQGHSDDQNDAGVPGYVGLEICRPAIEYCDWVHAHQYWWPGRVLELVDQNGRLTKDLSIKANRDLALYNGPFRFVLMHELFPDKRIFISEAGQFNTRRSDAPEEIVRWFKSLSNFPYVVGATPFIYADPTRSHYGNDWSQNLEIKNRVTSSPKEAFVPMPNVGQGFRKVESIVGPFLEDELYHFPGTNHEVSMAVGQNGFAVWNSRTNETIAYKWTGQELWGDKGNLGDGIVRRIRPLA